jgi:hypothetical protein
MLPYRKKMIFTEVTKLKDLDIGDYPSGASKKQKREEGGNLTTELK